MFLKITHISTFLFATQIKKKNRYLKNKIKLIKSFKYALIHITKSKKMVVVRFLFLCLCQNQVGMRFLLFFLLSFLFFIFVFRENAFFFFFFEKHFLCAS